MIVAKANASRNGPEDSVARVLRDCYPDVKFRAAFLEHPLLRQWTVSDVLGSAGALDRFLSYCRTLPQFGEVQERRLRKVLQDLAGKLDGHPAQGTSPGRAEDAACPPPMAEPTTPSDDSAALAISGEYFPDFVSAWRAVYLRGWRLAHFEEFYYFPSSIPEFVKHPDVLRAEIGPQTDLSAYLAGNATLRKSLSAMRDATGLILLDRRRLDRVFGRRGPYAGLSEAAIGAQIGMLRDLIAILPSSLTVQVCDTDAAKLSPSSAIGDLVTISAMGGYLVTRDSALQSLVAQRYRAAAQTGVALSAYLNALDGSS